MMQPEAVHHMLSHYRPGHSLPREFYHDAILYRAEMDNLWRQMWLFAGHACQIPNAGDWFTYDVDGDSIIIVRQSDGTLGALHNVCRHRGSVIADEPCGHNKSFVCPYHQWTYALDGQLLYCRHMPADTNKSALGLRRVHVRDLTGLIYICLADTPPAFDAAQQLMEPMAKPQGFAYAKVAKAIDYAIHANWKLVWENNRECYHCDANHPQYVKANFDRYDADNQSEEIARQIDAATLRSAAKWAACGLAITHAQAGLFAFPDAEHDIWYSANRTALVDGYVTESLDDHRVAPLMGEYADEDVGTLHLRTLPNFWCHASCDHAVTTRLTPKGPRLTQVRVLWLVDESAQAGRDYTLDRLLPFWQLTSEQDWAICERQQRGVDSHAYTPGPLSQSKEYNVDSFLRWYVGKMGAVATTRV